MAMELQGGALTEIRGALRWHRHLMNWGMDSLSTSQFKLWAASDAHVGTDLVRGNRRSLAEAILQSERGEMRESPFDWDIMLNAGDYSGSQTPPDDEEGEEVVRQYGVSTKHTREDFTIWSEITMPAAQKRKRSGGSASGWIRSARIVRTPGFMRIGGRTPFLESGKGIRSRSHILFLVMGDRNDGGPPIGRGEYGGYPAGAVTRETFEWWVRERRIEPRQDHHLGSPPHAQRDHVASGPWEGVDGGYHGRFEDGAPIGASYLYFVGGVPDAGSFETYLAKNPGAIDIWIGGTHITQHGRHIWRSVTHRAEMGP